MAKRYDSPLGPQHKMAMAKLRPMTPEQAMALLKTCRDCGARIRTGAAELIAGPCDCPITAKES